MMLLYAFFALWSVIGFLLFAADTCANEDAWTRAEDPCPTWMIFAGGPLLWLLYSAISLIGLTVRYFG
jgi:uncharacterized membrane protein YsdA (DUF1294 family)